MRTYYTHFTIVKFLFTRTFILISRTRYINVVGIFALTLENRDLIVDAPLSLVICSGSGCYLPSGVDSYLFAHVVSKGLKS